MADLKIHKKRTVWRASKCSVQPSEICSKKKIELTNMIFIYYDYIMMSRYLHLVKQMFRQLPYSMKLQLNHTFSINRHLTKCENCDFVDCNIEC